MDSLVYLVLAYVVVALGLGLYAIKLIRERAVLERSRVDSWESWEADRPNDGQPSDR